MRTLTVLLATATTAATLVSCVKINAFKCGNDDSACGANGQCESDGLCSIPSDSCPTGRQYSDTAGDLANQCVGGGPNPDGPIPDGPPPTDGEPPDTPPAGCTVGYDTITDGNPNHKYMLVANAGTWVNQQNTVCNASGGYLAIPDDAAELAAIFVKGGSVLMWLAPNDRLNEGSVIDTKNQPYVALPITGNGNNDDCATTNDGTAPLEFADCEAAQQLQLPTVCECEE
jgi:hypothetical protein